MNVFNKIAAKFRAGETTLGNPLNDRFAISRRLTHFAALTNGEGFRQPKETPKKDAQGMTRGDRKRARHARAFANRLSTFTRNSINEHCHLHSGNRRIVRIPRRHPARSLRARRVMDLSSLLSEMQLYVDRSRLVDDERQRLCAAINSAVTLVLCLAVTAASRLI